MKEMRDSLIEMMGEYIVGATDEEFDLEQSKRMVRLVLRAYKCVNQTLTELTGL